MRTVLDLLANPFSTYIIQYFYDNYIPVARKYLLDPPKFVPTNPELDDIQDKKAKRSTKAFLKTPEICEELLDIVLHILSRDPNTLFYESSVLPEEVEIKQVALNCLLKVVEMLLSEKLSTGIRYQCYALLKKVFFGKFKSKY